MDSKGNLFQSFSCTMTTQDFQEVFKIKFQNKQPVFSPKLVSTKQPLVISKRASKCSILLQNQLSPLMQAPTYGHRNLTIRHPILKIWYIIKCNMKLGKIPQSCDKDPWKLKYLISS